jgi:heme exporter protein D
MEWASWSEFWSMGGYGLYVWGSYGATFIAILIEVMFLRRASKDTRRRLKRMQQWDLSSSGEAQ